MKKEINIWGKINGDYITLQLKSDDLETAEVEISLKTLPPVMVRLTQKLKLLKKKTNE